MLKILYHAIHGLSGLILLPFLYPIQPLFSPVGLLAAAPQPNYGAYYFVDGQNGNDSYSGRLMEPDANGKDGPVRTIQSGYERLRPGNTLYIKKGTYREALRLTKTASQFRPILIQVFPGDEGQVIISGSDPVITWNKCTDQACCAGNPHWQQIFYADINQEIRQVFQGHKRLRPSRYPAEGWLYPASISTDSQTGFYDPSIHAIKDLNIGVCNIRTAPWHLDQISIQSYSTTTAKLTLAAPTRYPISLSCGYYLTNMVSQINQEGQWAFDHARRRLYLWPIGGSPNDVEVTVRDYGIAAAPGCSYHTIRGLAITSAKDGIRLEGSSYILLTENYIDWSFNIAVLDSSTSFSTISQNTIRYTGYAGIVQDELSTNGLIEGNFIYATGAQTAGEDLVNGNAVGMGVFGIGTRVIGNRIDRTGYDGLYAGRGNTSNREFAYNYITNSCLSLADGAGIYTDGHSNSSRPDRIHHNIVADTWGWLGGWARNEGINRPGSLCVGEGYGIYLDEQANARIVEYNTVLYCSTAGIFVHWAKENQFSGNTLFGNGACQILLVGKDDPRFRLQGNSIYDNLLIATSPYQNTLRIHIDYSAVDLAGCDRNRYYHPSNPRHIFLCSGPSVTCNTLSLAQWRAVSRSDMNSIDLWSQVNPLSKDPVILANPYMATSTIQLMDGQYLDPFGGLVKDSINLGPFESVVLIPLTLAK